jgi:adenosylhomocysteine nucleosidase
LSRIGIIAALPAEAKCLYRKKLKAGLPIEIQQDVFLCLSGIGHESALFAAKKLAALKVDALISWGVAGAIDKSVNSGDVILANSIINEGHRYSISKDWLSHVSEHLQSTSRVCSGDIASSKEICASTTDKHHLLQKTGALAVDMESAAIAEAATANNLDLLVIRSISDNADTSIPEAVLKHTNNLGQPRIFNFMLSCILKPNQIREISALATGYKKGLASLSSIAQVLKDRHFLYSDS